jgi:uncharacterized protein (TIGR04222 family)
MNPFDLTGPDFLVFYLILAVSLLAVLFLLRRFGEPDPSMPVHLTDPYEIAYLRGRANEVMRLATIGLIDRGLLSVNGSKLSAANQPQAGLVKHPVERGILRHFAVELEASTVFSDSLVQDDCDKYASRLTHLGLLEDDRANKRRTLACAGVVAVLCLFSIVKIYLAIERGHRNIGLLILLTVLSTFAAFAIARRVKRTRRGDFFLGHMRSLFESLRLRSSTFIPHANTSELLLLGAIFGIAALPSSVFPYTRTLYRRAMAVGASSRGGSSCGSSCSSGGSSCGSSGSSCSSGGSSCGGGGGGGGCGGCGS